MAKKLYDLISAGKEQSKKAFAVLIDPDKLNESSLLETIQLAVKSKVDYIFVGGSLVVTDTLDTMVATIKQHCSIPVISSLAHQTKSPQKQMHYYTFL
jgi:putative glycerol-1-phosphate prenyltransferase